MTDPQPSRSGNFAKEQVTPSPFNSLMGYRLEAWEPDLAVVAYEIKPEHLNRTQRVHGGVLASILDAVMGYAGCFAPEGERRAALTLTMTVNFVGGVDRGRLKAVGRRVGGGRTVFFAEGEVRDASGRLLATSSGTFRYLAPEGRG